MSSTGLYTDTGVFVCFEGGEGGGKSTQSQLLHDWLTAEGYSVVLTRQPGGTEVGKQVRQIVLSPETGELSHRTEALLYAADKAEHVDTVLLPALRAGQVVVTDRYVDSAIAYQGSGRDLDAAEVTWVNRWATGDLRPHLTVLLDLEPQQGLGRFAERDRIEAEGVEFHQRVREAFQALAAADPDHYLVLDARATIPEIAAAIQARLTPLLVQAARR
ncbi:dTMP kinase [Nocardioides sp. Bht2]|uniref:dTMP kinase n=1 Tax=Nocardioides sp. Bht2 TaxID=3392297 RepID=UPI0039B6BCC6